jgi:type IV pilus assembly protein PilW
MNKLAQSGMTLLEIMISLAVAMIVLGSVGVVYISTVRTTGSMLMASKLNQELTAASSVIVNDMRRAGYWGNMTPANYAAPQANPFAQLDNTALEVHAANVQQPTTGSGECIVYAYDADNDGIVDNADIRGFRLVGTVVQMRERGDTVANATHDSCNNANDTWLDVTDGNLIAVTALTFDLAGSTCLNSAEPDGEEDGGDPLVVDDPLERDCYTVVPAAGSGDITVETRQVTITLSGRLANDPIVTYTLSQDARVRNDLVRVR